MKKLVLTLLVVLVYFGSNKVESKTDWYSLNICPQKDDLYIVLMKIKVKECRNVGKSLYIYMDLAKIEVKIGPVVGVVYLKKGQNRGTNEVRPTEKNGYYYLIDDAGDKDNLLTVLPIKEHSFK